MDQYPLLEETPRTVIQSPADSGRSSEFYPPWESDNPRPGQATVELFGRQPPTLPNAEMIHLLGSVDPRNNVPVDPWFRHLKKMVGRQMPALQKAWERGRFNQDHEQGDTFSSWWDRNRADAYIRAYLYPEFGVKQDSSWQEAFTPNLLPVLKAIQEYARKRVVLPSGNQA